MPAPASEENDVAHRFPSKPAGLIALVCCVVAILSLIIVKFVPGPYRWVGALWSILGFAAAMRLARWKQTILLTFASFCIAVSVSELLAGFLLQPKALVSIEPPYIQLDQDLGWRNATGVVTNVAKEIGGENIYSAKYTIDAAGRRISPPANGEGVLGCAVFFADSFTFGEGVSDEEAYPYRVGILTGGKFQIINLGVSGYGAHHMVAQLERDHIVAGLECTPTHVFYLALPHHVLRAADKVVPGGPLYELGDDIELHRRPRRDHVPDILIIRLLKSGLKGSYVYRLFQEKYPDGGASEIDLERYFAIVARAGRQVQERWPRARLHIFAWNLHGWFAGGFDRFRSGLARSGWQLHEVDAILPDYQKNLGRYVLHRFDHHPNPLAYNLLAAYVADNILASTHAGGSQ